MSILNKASLVITPTAYKEDKLYSIVPKDGSGDLTWTRATDATRINKDGYVERVPYNLLSYSEQFDTYWNKVRSSISPDIISAPNGTLTADKLIENTDNNNHHTSQTCYTTSIGAICGSVFLKAGERTFAYVRITGSANGTPVVGNLIVNLITGVITYADTVFINYGITLENNGFFRVWGSLSQSNTNRADLQVFIAISGSYNPNPTYLGDGVSGIYVWGAQLVEGSVPKDYFPTINRQDVPRITYTTTGGTPSILIEPQRTNLTRWSNRLSLSNWVSPGSFIEDIVISPEGIPNATQITTIDGNSRIQETVTGYNGFMCISAYLKYDGVNYTSQLNTFNSVNSSLYGATVLISNGDPIFSSYQLGFKEVGFENMGNGWYRVWAVCQTLIGGNTIAQIRFSITPNTPTIVKAYGVQMEVGSYPTSYIPTTTAAVTRNADVVEKTNISDLIGQTEGTVLFNVDVNSPTTGLGSQSLVVLRPSSGSFMTSYISTSGSLSVDFYPQGSYLFSLNGGSIGLGKNKIAIVYKSGNYKLFKNGTLLTSNNNNTTPNLTLSVLTLANTFNGSRKNITLFKQALTDAECITLTTL